MNNRQLAHIILTRRNQNTPIFNNAEMVEALGADGYQEALRRRWIEFTEDGYGQVTNHIGRVQEMADAVNSDELNVGDQVVVADGGRSYTAAVQAKNANGAYTLSFGNEKPSAVRPEYRREELQAVKPEVGASPTDATRSSGPSRNYPGMPGRGDIIPGVGVR